MSYQPKYKITNKILNYVSRAEAAKAIIETAPLIPSWERKFQSEAVIRTIHYSTHIEGNPLKFDEVKQIVEGRGEKVLARERDIQEIINYRRVMEFLDDFVERENPKITTEVIKEIHAILAEKFLEPDRAGKYRQHPATSRNSITKEISIVYPNPDEIAALVNAFVDWLNSPDGQETHPILRAGIIHHELARIHPFDDLNGRVSRVTSTLSLYLNGYDIKNFFSLEEHFDADARNYYQSLKSIADKDPDMTNWLEYFAEGLAIEFARVKERVLKLSKDAKLKKAVGQITLSERQEKIVEFIQDNRALTNKDYSLLFPNVSDDTVLRELSDLRKKGVIEKEGSTKSAKYVLK